MPDAYIRVSDVLSQVPDARYAGLLPGVRAAGTGAGEMPLPAQQSSSEQSGVIGPEDKLTFLVKRSAGLCFLPMRQINYHSIVQLFLLTRPSGPGQS